RFLHVYVCPRTTLQTSWEAVKCCKLQGIGGQRRVCRKRLLTGLFQVRVLVGEGCGLAVSWVYPLNPDSREFEKVPPRWVPRHADEQGELAARKKLRRYFKRMGFERVAGTKFDALPLARVTPTLADLLRPGKRRRRPR